MNTLGKEIKGRSQGYRVEDEEEIFGKAETTKQVLHYQPHEG